MNLIYPVPDELDQTTNKYALVVAAAKRARQLSNGAQPLVPSESTNPLTVALEEIGAGMVIPVQTQPVEELEDIRLRTSVPGVAATLGVVAVSPVSSSEDPNAEQDEILAGEDDERLVDMGEELVGTILGTGAEGQGDEAATAGLDDEEVELELLDDESDLL